MLVLAVDTSGRIGSVALARDSKLLVERFFEPARGHGGRLLAEIDEVLRSEGPAPGDVDLFAACAGPGSFTGVRVGLATVNALAWSLGRPVTAFDSLAVLARNVSMGFAAPVLDARKGEVYGALYEVTDDGFQEVIASSVSEPRAWRDRVSSAAKDVTWLGSGVAAYPDVFEDGGVDHRVRASQLALLAEAAYHRDPAALPTAAPRYIRPSEAEVKFGPAPAHDPMRRVDVHS